MCFYVSPETWLTDNFSELGLDSFNIFRYVTCNATNNCLCGGGGVLIGVRKDITVYPVQITTCSMLNTSFETVSIGRLRFVVGGVHIALDLLFAFMNPILILSSLVLTVY